MADNQNYSFHALAGRQIIQDVVDSSPDLAMPVPLPPPTASDAEFSSCFQNHTTEAVSEPLRICIIGAGVAGLRTAMLLDRCGIDYDIFEGSDRDGGRAYTYHFTDTTDYHDYFDLGAMRFPKIKILERTFALFKELGLEHDGKIIPYIMQNPKNIRYFNGKRLTQAEVSTKVDPFEDGKEYGGNVPIEYLKAVYVKHDGTTVTGVNAVFEKGVEPYKLALVNNFCTGWKKLMEADHYSAAGFFSDVMKYPFPVVQWMERSRSSTGSFDLAFSETVLSSLEFDYPGGSTGPPGTPVDWYCIDGGTSILTDRMCARIKHKPTYNHRVAAIRMKGRPRGGPEMYIRFLDKPEFHPQSYSHIISTVPLSSLSLMDLNEAGLSYVQRQAIRTLGYGEAIKIGIKFKTRWWQTIPGSEQIGGLGTTDRPIRTIVYPSYGLDDPADAPGVLMVSYTWTQDSSRLGSFMQGKDSKAEADLLHIVYQDLEMIHGKTAAWYKEQTITHKCYNWYHNEYSVGAYAHFRPGQFSNLYRCMNRPAAKGNLHFVGEAISVQHGWIEGALASIWRGIYHTLFKEQKTDLLQTFLEAEATPEEVIVANERLQILLGIHEPLDTEG